MSTLSQKEHNSNQEIFNSFKFYHPRNVWLFCVLSSFAMFYDQGTTFSCVPMIREDHTINSIEDHSASTSTSSSLTNYSTTPSPVDTIQKALSTTYTGIFSSMFMVGFVIACPIAQTKLGQYGSNRLVQFGLCLWAFGALAVACSPNYYVLVACRFIVGFSEGWFVNLLTVYVDNIAPKKSKMLWLAIFYSGMPIATSIGLAVGSEIGSNLRIGSLIPGWRIAYFIQFPIGLILFAVALGLPKEYNIYQQTKKDEEGEKQKQPQQETNYDSVSTFARNDDDAANNLINASTPSLHHPTTTTTRKTENPQRKNQVQQQEFMSFGAALNQLLCHNLDYTLLVSGICVL